MPAEIRPEKTRDRFVRGWTIGCAAALVLGSAFPYDPSWSLDYRVPNFWPSPYLAVYYPLLLAGLAVGTLGLKDRLRRGAMLLILASAAVLAHFIHLLHSSTRGFSLASPWEADVLVARFQMILGAVLVASGNRIMRSFPHRATPRILLGTGGALLIASFLLSWESWGRSALHEIIFDGYVYAERFRLGAGIVLLVYGGLGFLTAFARYRLKTRYLILSVGAGLVVVGCMIVLWSYRDLSWANPPFSVPVMCLKLGLLVVGHAVLLALGLAAWVEELLIRKEAVPSAQDRPA